LDMPDAVLWLLPILTAIEPSAPFDRLIIRTCSDWSSSSLPFPFKHLDRHLSRVPAVKVLLGWAYHDDDFLQVFQYKLPRLHAAGRIKVLHASGPLCE
jgi:hypothetical protein